MAHPSKTSSATEAYIRQHMDDAGLSRAQLAKEAGVSISTLYRIIREAGGKLDLSRARKREGVEDFIRKYYPTMSAHEIAKQKPEGWELSPTRIKAWVKRLGLTHTPETKARLKAKREECRQQAYTPEAIARRSESRKKLFRMENWRVDSGLKQRTRLRLRRMPKRTYKASHYLRTQRGYIETTDPFTLWYDEKTQRSPQENVLSQRYGFIFEADPECSEMAAFT